MTINKLFGQNLKKYRLRKKYSQEYLAEICGLHRTYISSIELGKKSPSLQTIEILANKLEIDIYFLFKY